MHRNAESFSADQDQVVSAVVVTLNRDAARRQRAVAEIAAHPAIRVAAIKDLWLPLAVEARDQRETQQIHHWITSLDGVEVADVIAISAESETETAVNLV